MVYGDRGPDSTTLWGWDGAKWRAFREPGPGLRRHIKLAYDPVRDRLVLYGGLLDNATYSLMGDTWEWDGSRWERVATVGPGPRASYSLVYDRARKRVVMFGGLSKDSIHGDTWSWDGRRWTKLADAGPSRFEAGISYDVASQRIVIAGGKTRVGSSGEFPRDTWAWDGSKWERLAEGGFGRVYGALVADPVTGTLMRIGGESDTAYHGDTWRWSGGAWQVIPNASIPVRHSPGVALDTRRMRIVVFGGSGGTPTRGTPLADLWEWDGARWEEIKRPDAPPPSLAGGAFDESRNRFVAVGGNAEEPGNAVTREWDGVAWASVSTAGPSSRNEPLMVYDRARRRVVLYGGDRANESPATDTWSWTGISWTRLAVDGPSPRAASMVYDSQRDRIVLFGGAGPTGLHNDTWEFDGTRWKLVVRDSAAASPPARALAALAYDSGRARVVLTAGFAGFDPAARGPKMLDDTWEWDGRSWTQVNTPGPGARDHAVSVYDPTRGVVILHGGGILQGSTPALIGDTWSYDGRRWTRLREDGPPRGRHRLVYDSRAKGVLLYGGWAPGNIQSSELWKLGDTWNRVSPP